jgi:hypothetical protein
VAEQPDAFVTVTSYVVAAVGFTVILAFEDPFDQAKELPPLAVKVVDCPLQIAATPEILAVGVVNKLTALEVVEVHPLASVTVTL